MTDHPLITQGYRAANSVIASLLVMDVLHIDQRNQSVTLRGSLSMHELDQIIEAASRGDTVGMGLT